MAERVAINSPIQGTAADIIKKAMIKVDERLRSEKLPAKLLLQVHDELIFEVPEDHVSGTIQIVRKTMENAAFPALDIAVPLKVDAQAADNWDEAH